MSARQFTLKLFASRGGESIEGLSSFVGEDASGSFGLMPGHAPWMTALSFGLARFRLHEQTWHFLALPGGLASFRDNILTISTRRYLISTDYQSLQHILEQDMQAEELAQTQLRHNLQLLERDLLKHLWDLGRKRQVSA